MIINMWPALFTLFKTSIMVFIANDVLKKKYSDKYDSAIINISYNLIYLFSRCQIIITKVCSGIIAFANSNPQAKKIIDSIYSNNIVQNQLYIINHMGETVTTWSADTDTMHTDNCIYVFADNEAKNKVGCVNMVILRTPQFLTNYTVSSIKFMLIEIKIHDVMYKLNLKTDLYNYYIVDNRLDHQFFIYFLKKYQIYDFKNNTEQINSFTVKIIDHNVNVREFEITQNKFITIQKDDYTY